VEYAQMKIMTLLDPDGELLKTLYPFFNRELIMELEDYQAGSGNSAPETTAQDTPPEAEQNIAG